MGNELNRLAVSATNHCLTGCGIGESRGLSVRVHGHRYLIARSRPSGSGPGCRPAGGSVPTTSRYRDIAMRRGGAVGGEPQDPAWFREDFRVLIDLLREGKIHPVVAERLPLSEARHAHEQLEESAAKGKLVLVP